MGSVEDVNLDANRVLELYPHNKKINSLLQFYSIAHFQ